MAIRTATHADSWYSGDKSKLGQQLSTWLAQAGTTPNPKCKAVIAPHAGYSYSGPAAAWAYKAIDTTNVKRVFVLGPSHHVYLNGCALSTCKEYETPLGNLVLDVATIAELKKTGKFQDMTLSTDEDEHSIEMHLPYIRHIFSATPDPILLVPILIGSISPSSEKSFGALLAPYLSSPSNIFIISSDFCHWGTRFNYTYYLPDREIRVEEGRKFRSMKGEKGQLEIWESIERLDQTGMDLIAFDSRPPSSDSSENASPAASHDHFSTYLEQTKNTICGRHPIGVLLGALSALEEEKNEGKGIEGKLEWVRYEQSSKCLKGEDSSVSYASAVLTLG